MAIVIVDSEREWYVPFEREMEREGYKVHFPRYEELMAHLEMAEGSDPDRHRERCFRRSAPEPVPSAKMGVH